MHQLNCLESLKRSVQHFLFSTFVTAEELQSWTNRVFIFQICTYVWHCNPAILLYANDYWIIFNLGAILISTIKFLTCQKITPRLYHNFILFPHQAFLLSLYQHFLFIICSVKNGYRSISILNNKNLSYRSADLLEGILMDADSLILLANQRSWLNWSK